MGPKLRSWRKLPYRLHCGLIQGHTALAGGRFGLADFDFSAGDVVCPLSPAHFLYSLAHLKIFMLQVNVAIEQAQYLACPQSCVQHENVGCWLLVLGLTVGVGAERLRLEFLDFFWRENCDGFLRG